MRLVLASGSPRRAELLTAAGFSFRTLAMDIDETVRPAEPPAQYVRRLALEKSAQGQASLSIEVVETIGLVELVGQVGQIGPVGQVVVGRSGGGQGLEQRRQPDRHGAEAPVVLGADTAVVVDGDILGKPRDTADAERMLRRLSGRRHEVLTGVSLRRNETELGGVETTAVDFLSLTDADVDWYCRSGEGLGKAGAYAIQGLASRFITRIEGSYSNVVGLPVALVFELLQHLASSG